MTRRQQLRGGLYLCVLLTMLMVWIGQARDAKSQGNTFTGHSFRVDSEGINGSSRGFEAGARTHWHTHSAQLLFVKEGRLRYQVEGSPVTDIGLHETTYLPLNRGPAERRQTRPSLYGRTLSPEGTGPTHIQRHGAGLASLAARVGQPLVDLAILMAAREYDV